MFEGWATPAWLAILHQLTAPFFQSNDDNLAKVMTTFKGWAVRAWLDL